MAAAELLESVSSRFLISLPPHITDKRKLVVVHHAWMKTWGEIQAEIVAALPPSAAYNKEALVFEFENTKFGCDLAADDISLKSCLPRTEDPVRMRVRFVLPMLAMLYSVQYTPVPIYSLDGQGCVVCASLPFLNFFPLKIC